MNGTTSTRARASLRTPRSRGSTLWPPLLWVSLLWMSTSLPCCSQPDLRPPRSPARLALLAGDAAWGAEDLETAKRHYRRALSLSLGAVPAWETRPEATPNDTEVTSSRQESGSTNRTDTLGDRPAETLALNDELEELDGEDAATGALALNQLGLIAEHRGKLRDAENLYRSALKLQPSIESAQDAMIPHLNLASVLYSLDRVAEAESSAKTALKLADLDTDWLGAGHAHRVLGEIYAGTGRSPLALSHLGRASMLLERAGELAGAASARRERAQVLLETGEARQAIREFSSARQSFRRFDDTEGEFRAMLGLARSYVAIGEELNALTFWERLLCLPEWPKEAQRREQALREALELLTTLDPAVRGDWSSRLRSARPRDS